MARLKHYVLGLLFLIWVSIFFARIPMPLQQPGVFLAVNGALFAGIVVWIGKGLYAGHKWRWSPFVNYFGLYIVMRLLWLAFAPMPLYGSMDKALTNIILFLIFVFFLQHFENWRRARAWESALISIAIIYAGFELLLGFLWLRNWWNATGLLYSLPPVGLRVFGGLLEHPNVMSGFLNLIIPVVLTRLIVGTKRDRKVVWVGVLILFMVIQFFTSSRGGWISGIVGVMITLGLLYFPEILDGNIKERLRQLFTPGRAALVVITAGMFIFGFVTLLSVAEATPGHGGRLDIWATALQVWEENWMIGRGTGAFEVNYVQVVQAPPGFIAERAHSIIFQMGAEHGFLGLALTLLIIWMGAMTWLRAWKSADKNNRDVLAAYAGVGAAAVMHNSGDYLLGSIVYTTSLLMMLSLVVVRDPLYSSTRMSSRRMGIMLFFAVAILAAGFSASAPGVEKYNLGVTSGMDSDWEAARENICDIADERETFSLYQFQCGLASAQLYQSGEYDLTLLQDSADYYQRGLEMDTYWPVHQANLAVLKWQLGENNAAIAAMQQAVDDAPRNTTFAIQLGWMAEQVGNEELAVSAYTRALEKDPWLTESAFFEQSKIRRSVRNSLDFDSFLDTSDQLTIRSYREIKVGNLEKAEALLRESLQLSFLNANAHALLGVVLDKLSQPDEGWIQIQTALLMGESPRIFGWASQIALSQGREEEGADYLLRAFSDMTINVNNSEKYYAGVYHRYSFMVDLVPGFLQIDLLPELVDGLFWLGDYYAEQGDLNSKEELLRWMETAGWLESGN